MDSIDPASVTRLLGEMQRGDQQATDRLMETVYPELRALAESFLSRERSGHTLQATALAHEAYLRLVDQRDVGWQGRSHFLAMAATMIRRILVDHARGKAAVKRGGDRQRLTLSGVGAVADRPTDVDLLDLHESLELLAARGERPARVVELRFFGGLTVRETAAVLGVSEPTVKEDWRFARAWLLTRLGAA